MRPDAAKRARRPHFTVWGWLTRWVGGPEHRQTLGRPVRRGLGGRGRGRPELGELEGDECVDEHLRVEHGCGGDAGGEVLATLPGPDDVEVVGHDDARRDESLASHADAVVASGRASGRGRGCQYVLISGGGGAITKKQIIHNQ